MTESTTLKTDSNKDTQYDFVQLGTLGVLLAALLFSYWNTLSRTAEHWDSPQYSHGWLVPLFAIALLWMRYEPLKQVAAWEHWAGLGLLGLGLAMRLTATGFALVIPDMVSFIPSLAGIVLLVGGVNLLRWAGPAILFLLFMYPLPDRVENMILNPLQRTATVVSTFALQTMGVPAFSEGNRILLPNVELGVVDACSGLRMLTIFLALSVAITMVTDRPWWERIVIILSAIPIALIVNITRITATGLLYMVNEHLAERVFHDLAGWVMMPMALGLMYVELQLLSHLFIEDDSLETSGIDFGPQHPASI